MTRTWLIHLPDADVNKQVIAFFRAAFMAWVGEPASTDNAYDYRSNHTHPVLMGYLDHHAWPPTDGSIICNAGQISTEREDVVLWIMLNLPENLTVQESPRAYELQSYFTYP